MNDSPVLAGVEKSSEYHCTVDLQLIGEADSVLDIHAVFRR